MTRCAVRCIGCTTCPRQFGKRETQRGMRPDAQRFVSCCNRLCSTNHAPRANAGPSHSFRALAPLLPRCIALRDLLRRCWRWKACFGHNHGPPQGVRRTCCLIQQGRHRHAASADNPAQRTQVAAAARITHCLGLSGQKSRAAARELPRRWPNKRLHWFCRSTRVACSTAGLAGGRWRAQRGRLGEQGRAASATGRRARACGRPLRAQASPTPAAAAEPFCHDHPLFAFPLLQSGEAASRCQSGTTALLLKDRRIALVRGFC